MDRPIAELAIKTLLNTIRAKLDEAAGVAKAAEVCASTGNTDKAIEISQDIEQLSYEASRLLDAASLLNRLSQES